MAGGGAAARSKNPTQHFSGIPGVSAGAGLCRGREVQVFLSPLWLHICPLWPSSEEWPSEPGKRIWTWPCAHVGSGLSLHFLLFGFLFNQERKKQMLAPCLPNPPHPSPADLGTQNQGQPGLIRPFLEVHVLVPRARDKFLFCH